MAKNSTEHINETMNNEVSNASKIPSPTDAQDKLLARNDLLYLPADPFIANPYDLLGTVLEIRKVDGGCPSSAIAKDAVVEFSPSKILGFEIDENSKIKEPIKRASIMVDQKLSANVSFLTYLSAQFENNSSFSLMVFDQATGLVNRNKESWDIAVENWKQKNKAHVLDDPEVCYVLAVIGFVQKFIIRRMFKKFQSGIKGGAFGVNIDGELYTSSEDYSLDIRYGLQTVILKRPSMTKTMGIAPKKTSNIPTHEENLLVTSIANSGRISFNRLVK